MSLVPQSQRPPLTDLTLVRTLSDAPEHARDGVLDLGPLGARPNAAQLIAQAIAGPPPTILQQQYQSRIGTALTELARTAGALAAAADTLSPFNSLNAFQQLGVNSSRPDLVEGFASAGAQPAILHILVQQIASAQENAGFLFARGARTRIAAGSHQVVIRSAGRRTTVSTHIDPEDTNEMALGEMVRAINSANGPVTATLAYPTASTAQVTLVSRVTGRIGAFSIAGGQGSIAALTGIQAVVQPAQDASFLVDDVPVITSGNVIYMENGAVQLQLKATADQRVIVTVGANQDAVVNAVAMLAGAVDSMAQAIQRAGETLSADFVAEFSANVLALSQVAASVGIAIHPDNTMTVDEDALRGQLAAEPLHAQTVISGPNGLAHRLGHFANEVIGSPLSRFGAPNLIPQLPPSSSHPTPTALLASNTLSSLLYSQLLSQGMFVNSAL